MNILFVEDGEYDPYLTLIRDIARDVCTQPVSVEGHTSGERLDQLMEDDEIDTEELDIAVIDYDLGSYRINGIDIADRLRHHADSKGTDIHIVLLTGEGDEEVARNAGFESDIDYYIIKGNAEKEELYSQIQEVYDRTYFNFDNVIVSEEQTRPVEVFMKDSSDSSKADYRISIGEKQRIYLLAIAYALDNGDVFTQHRSDRYLRKAAWLAGKYWYQDLGDDIPEDLGTFKATEHKITHFAAYKQGINRKFRDVTGHSLIKPFPRGSRSTRIDLSKLHTDRLTVAYRGGERVDPSDDDQGNIDWW